ncbi:hypothetical protein AgCh_004183 [Apium graveolens]
MGFRDFNLAILRKQGWRFIKNHHSLRSIWEAKHIIAAGMRWKIGSGKSVNIVGQPWGWDEEILSDMFNTRDQQCIKRINLTESSEEDELYWGKEVSGHYSLRSAYRLLQQQKNLWRQDDQNSDGKELWVAPQIEYMKFSAYAAIFSEYNASGYALIVRDDHGDLVQARTQYLPSMVSSTMAEVLAIKEALSWIKSKG